MRIVVSSAFGSGPTELSAFDASLARAGVHNFNLIRLSSVIPPETDIDVRDGPVEVVGDWGDRLYVVIAERRERLPGAEAWAGIGWVQDESGKGLFVEHDGGSRQEVESQIRLSLGALVETRASPFGPVTMHVCGGTCEDAPVCAIVVAVYRSSSW